MNLAEGAVAPGLKAGNIVDRAAVVAAVRKALDGVAGTGRERSRDVTLVVPDAAVRVLLLDFDQLPAKAAEALPVVRFRLKKLLPFDADDAMVSYQVMSSVKGTVQVLAVAMPKECWRSMRAWCWRRGICRARCCRVRWRRWLGWMRRETPALVVNAGLGWVTTAIVQGGMLLLHRSVDMRVVGGCTG